MGKLQADPAKTPILGGDEGTRTPDPLLAKQVLYQLSYIPANERLRAHCFESARGRISSD